MPEVADVETKHFHGKETTRHRGGMDSATIAADSARSSQAPANPFAALGQTPEQPSEAPPIIDQLLTGAEGRPPPAPPPPPPEINRPLPPS